MVLAVLTLSAAQLLDLVTFVRMIGVHGSTAEANPFVRLLLVEHGLPLLVVAKIAALAVVVAVTVVLAGRAGSSAHRRTVTAVVATAVAAGVIGAWSNALTLL